MEKQVNIGKCFKCKHCYYFGEDEKAYCGQRGDYIEEQYPSCEGYQEVETR